MQSELAEWRRKKKAQADEEAEGKIAKLKAERRKAASADAKRDIVRAEVAAYREARNAEEEAAANARRLLGECACP